MAVFSRVGFTRFVRNTTYRAPFRIDPQRSSL
jgi:hypothetical protein